MSTRRVYLPTALLMAAISIAAPVRACEVPSEYIELSRERMTSQIASVFALTGDVSKLNVTTRLESGEMIMMTIPAASAERGDRLVVEKVVHEDKLKNSDPRVHYDFIELVAD